MEVKLLSNAEVRAIGFRAQRPEILDLRTGKTYNVFWGGQPVAHTDFTPLTPADTEIMRSISNGWNWVARPAVVTLTDNGGQVHHLAVGVHHFPHGSIIGGNPGPTLRSNPNCINTRPNTGAWSRNPFGGHMCMWWTDSRMNSGNNNSAYALSMRAAAREAFDLAQKLILEEEEMVFRTLNDMPDGWLKEATAQLIADGVLSGTGTDPDTGAPIIDVTERMIRTIVINQRQTRNMIAEAMSATVSSDIPSF